MIFKLRYPDHFRDHAKKRCEYHTKEMSPGYSARTCKRYAVYSMDGVALCVQHAGASLLDHELRNQKLETDPVDISHLDKAELFLALYLESKPVVPAYMRTPFHKEVLSYEYPRYCFDNKVFIFNFVSSCPLMVDLSGSTVNTAEYDFYNGEGAFMRALATLEKTNEH